MNNAAILVIDDELQIRRLLEITLESNNFIVESADSAKEGLRIAASHPPDDWHHEVVGDRLYDIAKGGADNDTDGEINDVALGDKFPEFLYECHVVGWVEDNRLTPAPGEERM